MSPLVDDVIGAWMKKAEANGELKNNPHHGKKLDLEDYFATPAHLRMGMKVLKNAGVTPPAVEMMHLIADKKKALEAAPDEATRAAIKRELVDLDLKYRAALDSLNSL